MIQVMIKSGTIIYPLGDTTYTQDHWLYVIDDDGKILGCHPEMEVQAAIYDKAGEAIMTSVNSKRPAQT